MNENKFTNDEVNSNESLESYLQFDLGNEAYAMHLLSVKEVIPLPETTPLPNSPSHYIGIMNLRGQIISIVDLRKKTKYHTNRKRVVKKQSLLLKLKALELV